MKKLATNTVLCVQPLPQTIVSCRDKDGKNNALVVGFVANVSLDPVMVMVGITPARYSHHIVKESDCFVINFPKKAIKKSMVILVPLLEEMKINLKRQISNGKMQLM